MNNIDILEELKEWFNNFDLDSIKHKPEEYIQAISTLIAEYKELKEEVKRQSMAREIEEKFMEDNYVSKIEIREEIEKQKEMKVDGELFKTAVNYAIKILQSLLGKE